MSNQERQIAYRQVVQALLECPHKDEQRILSANPDLVDKGLVKALKDKAMMMMRRNSPELGATMQRLVNIAQQLERKLAATHSETVELEQEDYIKFSFELFQVVAISKGNGAIVHQFFDGHRAYFNEHLLAIFPQSIAVLLERAEDPDRQVYIRSIAQHLAIDLQTYPRVDRSIFRQLAIACKEQSLLVHSQPDEPIDLTETETEIEPTEIETEPELEPAEIEIDLSPEAETKPTNEDSQITTYFQLVQALLECPLNEEERVLAAHPELVDEGLVRALSTAAETLKELNNPDSVWTIEWLESFAAQLSQKLGLEQKTSQQTDNEESDVLLQEVPNHQESEEPVHQFTDINDNREIEIDDRVITAVTPTTIPIDTLKTSHAQGQIYFQQGEWQLAIDAYEIAMQAVETSRHLLVDEQQRQEMLDGAHSIYENAIQCAINLQNYPQAIQYTERSRTRQLVELMAQKNLSADGTNSPDLAEVETIDYPNIRQLIHNPHTAILNCYTTKDDTHIFIIKQSGTPTIHTCKTQGWQKFQDWLQKTWINPSRESNSTWATDLPRLLHDISQRLELDTLIEQHLTNINELIIIPHLNLHQIPFAALPIEDGLLSDKFIIRSIPSYQISPPVATHSTLWSVDDYVSVILNVMYHQEQRKGTNRAISLHTAQSQLRNLTGAEFQRNYYPHAIEYATKHHPTLKTPLEEHLNPYCKMDKPFESPYYWAAFITQGMA
jgi:CHAT domain-containing protein